MTNYRSIAKSFIWVSVIFVFSKILGFAREMTLAATFGASFETDAFFVAIIIPTIIFANVFGTLQATVIPVYTRIKNYEPEEAAKLATALFYGTVMISLVFIFLGFNFTTYIVKMLAPSFTGETFLLTVKLARIMIFAVPFIALKSLATALLQYHNSFLIPAAAGIPYSIILIIATLCFGHKYGVAAVAIALILGYLCQLLIQVPQLLKLKVFDNNIILYHPGMKEIVVLTIPVLLGIIGNELNLIVDRILASGLTEGSISSLNFAHQLSMMPAGLFGIALVTVFYPQLNKLANKESLLEFKDCLERAATALIFLLAPMMLGFIILRIPIVQMLFQRGAFDEKATAMTAVALLYYSPGLLAVALNGLLARTFYSLHDTKIPVLVTLISVTLNIILNLVLIRYMAHAGLALATSIAAIVGLMLNIILLSRKIGGLNWGTLFKAAAKIFGTASFMGLVVWWVNLCLTPVCQVASKVYQAVILFLIIGLGTLIYFLISYLLKMKEAYYFSDILQSRLHKLQIELFKR
jgi:putative peptidoglycan lipid II flippase